jgi:hypothetical protein
MKRLVVAILATSVLALAGCVAVHHHDRHPKAKVGPPPHAPAHGYRHRHHGPDLVFDSRLGVYVAVGHPHVYFHGGHYYRRVSSGWQRCADWRKRRWQPVAVAVVPVPLVKHYEASPPRHGRPGRGRGRR